MPPPYRGTTQLCSEIMLRLFVFTILTRRSRRASFPWPLAVPQGHPASQSVDQPAQNAHDDSIGLVICSEITMEHDDKNRGTNLIKFLPGTVYCGNASSVFFAKIGKYGYVLGRFGGNTSSLGLGPHKHTRRVDG